MANLRRLCGFLLHTKMPESRALSKFPSPFQGKPTPVSPSRENGFVDCDSRLFPFIKHPLRVCLIMDAGSAGVPPATPEARIDHRQTAMSVCPELAEARIYRCSQSTRTALFRLIKHPLRVCLIMDAGSAGVPPATPEARIDHRQTAMSVCPELAEARIYGVHESLKQPFSDLSNTF